jgi:hypothetical protein
MHEMCVHHFPCSLYITLQELHLLPFSGNLLYYSVIIFIVFIYSTGGSSKMTKLASNLDGVLATTEGQ